MNQLTTNSTPLREPCLKTQDLLRWTPSQTVPWTKAELETAISEWSILATKASAPEYAYEMARLMTYLVEAYAGQIKDTDQIEKNWRECLRNLPADLLKKAVTSIIKDWTAMKKPTGAQIRSPVVQEAGNRKISLSHAKLALQRVAPPDDRPKVSAAAIDEVMAKHRAWVKSRSMR